jgi:hypothetical protein
MKGQRLLGLAIAIVLAGCTSAPRGPSGWNAMPGSTTSWTLGTGAAQQQYSYERYPANGSLHDLASQEVINVLLHRPGARFRRSDPFAPCPGLAAIETFTWGRRTLQEGFTVRNGQATVASYLRPNSVPPDPEVSHAMERLLCLNSA